MTSLNAWEHWILFLCIIAFLLVLDLGIFNKKQQTLTIKKSILFSFWYIVIAFLFGIWIFCAKGTSASKDYFTGYLIEKSLAFDNIFVISFIFKNLFIPKKYQHRVLFWGILGAIFFRGILISIGLMIILKFVWIIYLLGAFLIFTGIKMLSVAEKKFTLNKSRFFTWLQKHIPVTDQFSEEKFIISVSSPKNLHKKSWRFTPLFQALILIEMIDLVFAIDSIPAIFAITTDTYIVYTSNIFAILGLRALYFALNEIIDRFKYVKYALALILIFVGLKIFIIHFLHLPEFPAWISLVVILLLISGGVLYSWYKTR